MIEVNVKPGFTYAVTHKLFNIKMDSKFNHKARLVTGGHKTSLPSSITHSSAVTREIVRLSFQIDGLNNIDICDCGLGNAYINLPCRVKLWTEAGS